MCSRWKKKFNDVIHSKRLNINIDKVLKADRECVDHVFLPSRGLIN